MGSLGFLLRPSLLPNSGCAPLSSKALAIGVLSVDRSGLDERLLSCGFQTIRAGAINSQVEVSYSPPKSSYLKSFAAKNVLGFVGD